MISKTMEVRRIERISSEHVALYLVEVQPTTADGAPAPMVWGGEHRLELPASEEVPTGTRWTATYALEVQP